MAARRGPKKRNRPTSREVAPLRSQNVMVAGRRTSMRLEPSMWEALEDIARRETLSVNELCSRIKERLDEQARRRGVAPSDGSVTLTSAVRVFIAAYFRRASTDEGHSRAGHGYGDPFAGTPFEVEPQSDQDDGSSGGGSGQDASGSGRSFGASSALYGAAFGDL